MHDADFAKQHNADTRPFSFDNLGTEFLKE